MATCSCDWETGECQAPTGCKAFAEGTRLKDENDRLLARNAEHEERYSALEAREEYRRVENERLRLTAKRFANAIVTGQRHEGLICQAEDFLRGPEQSVR